jgi:hypothetical protein
MTAYFFFAAAIFVFMGAGLAFDAEHHAEAAAEWERLATGAARGKGRSRSLEGVYRLAGAGLSAFGVWLAAAALWFPGALRPFAPAELAPMARAAAGLLFVAISALLASFKLTERAGYKRKGHSWLGEDAPRLDPGRRLASASGWALLLTFLSFGLYLLSRRS